MKTKFSLLNKVALITGGGSGIVKEIAIIFAEQGADVKILDIDTNNAKKTVEDIVKNGFKASMYNCDVSNLNQVISTINEINKLKPIDILVNNAGIAHIGNIEACEEHELDKLMYVVKISHEMVEALELHTPDSLIDYAINDADQNYPDADIYLHQIEEIHSIH